MHFAAGRVTGAGADACGPFTIAGAYDTVHGTAVWTKIYPRYAVEYRGYAEQESLWGVWTLESGRDRGGFRLWPEKSRRENASTRTDVRRPAVIGGDEDARDPFADCFARELEPTGAA